MLSFNDWQLRLELRPSRLAQIYYQALAFSCVMLLLFCCWLFPWTLPAFALLYFHLREIRRRYVSLCHRKSVTAVECQDGIWKLTSLFDNSQNTFHLRAYSYNRHFVNLLFESSAKGFALFPQRNRVLIFADQVSDEDFRKLIVCLKYGRSDLQTAINE